MKATKMLFVLLCFTFTNIYSQQLIYLSLGNGDLVLADVSNCSYRFIGNSTQGFLDIAQCPNGKLFGIGGGLYEIDTANGSTTFITNDIAGGVSLVCNEDNDLILLGDYYPDSIQRGLLKFNTTTLKTSIIVDSINFDPYGDLAFNEGKLYSIGKSDTSTIPKLAEITLSPFSIKVISLFNDSLAEAYGMATIPSENCNTKLIAFSGNNAYEITSQGSSKIICQNFLEFGVYGASAVFQSESLKSKVKIPSAFTPNADNKNETFYPIFNGNFIIKNFRIYNRWGEVIHNNPTLRWDGTYKGVAQPEGAYIYQIEIENRGTLNCKESLFKKIGVITLLR